MVRLRQVSEGPGMDWNGHGGADLWFQSLPRQPSTILPDAFNTMWCQMPSLPTNHQSDVRTVQRGKSIWLRKGNARYCSEIFQTCIICLSPMCSGSTSHIFCRGICSALRDPSMVVLGQAGQGAAMREVWERPYSDLPQMTWRLLSTLTSSRNQWNCRSQRTLYNL